MAGEALNLLDLSAQRVTIIRIAGQRSDPKHELSPFSPSVGDRERELDAKLVAGPRLAFGDALHLGRVQGIDLVRVLGALRQQARDAGPGGRESGLQGRIPGNLAADVSLEPAQPGSHLAHVAHGLSMPTGVNEAAHLTLGAGG